MQASSIESDTLLVSVDKSDKFDNSALSLDCTQEQFRTTEASLGQVPRNDTKGSTENSSNKRTEVTRSVARDR